MSDDTLDVQSLNQFVILCETYIQFTAEYNVVESEDGELRAFCEYVKANNPSIQIQQQFEKLVNDHHQLMKTGVIVERNGITNTGEFFKKDYKDSVILTIVGGEREYVMSLSQLCKSIVLKKALIKKNDTRKNPNDILLYMTVVLAEIIKSTVKRNDTLPKPIRDSISMNTILPEKRPSRPYNGGQFENLRSFIVAGLNHSTVKGIIDPIAGEGMSEKGAQVIKRFDIGVITSQNNSQKVMETISTANIDGFVEHIKHTLASVANGIYESTNTGSPNDQC